MDVYMRCLWIKTVAAYLLVRSVKRSDFKTPAIFNAYGALRNQAVLLRKCIIGVLFRIKMKSGSKNVVSISYFFSINSAKRLGLLETLILT